MKIWLTISIAFFVFVGLTSGLCLVCGFKPAADGFGSICLCSIPLAITFGGAAWSVLYGEQDNTPYTEEQKQLDADNNMC